MTLIKVVEIVAATIVIILMRHRIALALMILLFPKSWVIQAMERAVEDISNGNKR